MTGTAWIAQRPEDMAGRADLAAMAGIEALQAMLRGEIAAPPICATMDFTMTAAEPGRVLFRGRAGFAHLNPMGTVHGGWYGAILDSAMGCAVMSVLARGQGYTTLEYKVNLTRALPPGTEAEATGTVAHAGRSTAVATAELRGVADGRLYASASTTCIILPG
ncbi:PaaI family thioesterase [Ruixingdingia sedimenti]|uniref:PaaI family thioesterase n=1 Tax=Ruixingdingia sedimenti TaxID=3073604 RepID=A0ABU1FD82_9RHOB|nr:PaaI family thioesterase [Xinfangfangia sp. LG-4]MDR5654538.1 PaaI family thioesterase [Xinfangfangia sp. LG-4]